jgi:acetyl-CoA acetyltransferase
MSETSWVVGAGITPFGRHDDVSGLDLAERAAAAALEDAGVGWEDVGFAVGGSMSAGNADSSVARLGLTGIPFVNVFNGCATGGSALNAGQAMIESGRAELVLVLGFDKHPAGAFDLSPADWGLGDWYGEAGLMVAPQFFAMRAQRYMHDHGITADSLARVASKAYANGALTPHAWRRKALTVDDVNGSAMVCPPLRQYMFCSPGSGAVALVLASPRRAARLDAAPVRLCASVFRTRRFGSFEAFSPSVPLETGASVTTDAASAAFAEAGIGPEDVDVAQLQDTDAAAEILHMAETGLCADGEQEEMIRRGETAPDGRLPVNTDGGCIANGEPVGASGLRQVHEIVVQLRGAAGERQVPGDPRVGFTQVYGAPGVSACTVLSR